MTSTRRGPSWRGVLYMLAPVWASIALLWLHMGDVAVALVLGVVAVAYVVMGILAGDDDAR